MKHTLGTGTLECEHCGVQVGYRSSFDAGMQIHDMLTHEESCEKNPYMGLLREIRDDMFERPEASLDDPPWMRKLDELLGA